MRFTARAFSGVPADPLAFWQKLHPHPTYGFFFGSGAATENDSIIYMSGGEPRRIFRSQPSEIPGLLKKIKKSFHPGESAPHFVGFFGFEAGRAFDPGIKRLPTKPNPLGSPAAM